MIDESDPAVVAMKAEFEQITTRHRQGITEAMAQYETREAENKARQEETARRQAAAATPPPPPPPKNPWLSRRNSPPPPKPSDEDDGTDTGYYQNTWMRNS
ncbi:hypothetical protein [Actinocrispum sp. NPDC049592]|uniref:hypothetical protein n=1 Tax=Actinocrispum sp. NPDC049592 TaxID=3154835 RepID=UPI003439E919